MMDAALMAELRQNHQNHHQMIPQMPAQPMPSTDRLAVASAAVRKAGGHTPKFTAVSADRQGDDEAAGDSIEAFRRLTGEMTGTTTYAPWLRPRRRHREDQGGRSRHSTRSSSEQHPSIVDERSSCYVDGGQQEVMPTGQNNSNNYYYSTSWEASSQVPLQQLLQDATLRIVRRRSELQQLNGQYSDDLSPAPPPVYSRGAKFRERIADLQDAASIDPGRVSPSAGLGGGGGGGGGGGRGKSTLG